MEIKCSEVCINLKQNALCCMSIVNIDGHVGTTDMLIDTGAAKTVLRLDEYLLQFIKYTGKTCTSKTVGASVVTLKEITLTQFTIETLDLGSTNVWLADDSFKWATGLLGMDILGSLDLSYLAKLHRMKIRKSCDAKTSVLKALCSDINIDYNVAIRLLPMNWEEFTLDELHKALVVAKEMG